jgi:hypothetical protein
MAGIKNSIYLSEELQNYLDKQCEAFGMGKSAFISMVLAMYRQQAQALNELSKVDAYMSRLEKLVVEKGL